MSWRENLDPIVQEHLNHLLKLMSSERKAYTKAKNVSHAQLWIALAFLMKEVSHLELKVKTLEKQLGVQKKNSQVKKSMEKL